MDAITACCAPGAAGLLAPLQHFLEDPHVSEILINRPQEVFVERNYVMQRSSCDSLTPQYLRRLFTLIANENKQVLSEERPILSGNLADGSRVQLVIPQVAQHETLSIRKFTMQQVSFEDYATQGFFVTPHVIPSASEGSLDVSIRLYSGDPSSQAPRDDVLGKLRFFNNVNQELERLYHKQDWHTFLTQAILAKKNILISGATSSGKTTFLNSCIGQIPLHERLIILEDTYEIKAPHPNVVRLKALKPLNDQAPGITMQDLVQASLRLRPDRLIMGEIRGREIFDFVSACSTGHSGALATIHASSPQVAFMRMAQLYKLNNVPGMTEKDIYNLLHEVIDVIIQIEKKQDGNRRVTDVYYNPTS